MSDPGHLSVTPADVLYSADYLDTIGLRATSERRALTTELAGNTMAWQEGGAVGFTAFIDVVRRQADQIGSEVADVATASCATRRMPTSPVSSTARTACATNRPICDDAAR